MKKLIIIIYILILTGCVKETINVEKPLSITYNNTTIVENDYTLITSLLNKIKFNCGKQQNYNGNILNIMTSNQVYKFHISSNYYMEFQKNDKYCYTEDSTLVKKLVESLDSLSKKYTDTTFYTIRTEKTYNNNAKDILIKLDKSDDYIIINSKYPLNNFRINEIEYNNETQNYIDIDLLYSNNIFDTDSNIIIRKEILHNPNFRISFVTPYNYLITILPILNENNEINYITNINKNS